MRWEEWKPFYLDIVERLGLDVQADRMATTLLTDLLEDIDSEQLLRDLKELVTGRTVIVCGAGPSLERHLEIVTESKEFDNAVYVAADGAISAFANLGLNCDIIVTDLDGRMEHIREAIEHGTLAIVHAHGDNMETVRASVPSLGKILGSTQVEPTDNVFLWGGFTDGDRACHIIAQNAPRRIVLAGMDFGTTVGKWSKPNHEKNFRASKRKRIKLQIAEELLTHLMSSSGIEYHVLS
jgi:uncharacterized Rossmann fold enzyme